MIQLPREENKTFNLEKQLEKLTDMKNIMLSSHSTVNLDYSLNIINNQIQIIEEKMKEKDLLNSSKSNEEVFDTEKYAEKAKAGK